MPEVIRTALNIELNNSLDDGDKHFKLYKRTRRDFTRAGATQKQTGTALKPGIPQQRHVEYTSGQGRDRNFIIVGYSHGYRCTLEDSFGSLEIR